MIEIKVENISETQLVLLKHIETGIATTIKTHLNEEGNTELGVKYGMMLKDRGNEDNFYEVTSNASFSLTGSYDIISIVKSFLQTSALDRIVPNTTLFIDFEFVKKNHPKSEAKEEKTTVFIPHEPKYKLEQVILSDSVRKEILDAINVISHKKLIYEEWGFGKVDPVPRSIINFYGEPGTGKTMCAHAIAHYLRRDILLLNYAEIESKYVGEAPKNLQAAFDTARKTDAVLFFDEADSFLGKRIQNVSHGSEQALNSLRSQMLILLEEFEGVVIFATNLVSNFDKAFESRILKHIYFPLPDENARIEIIKKSLPDKLPTDGTICMDNLKELTEISVGFSGREIKNAILDMMLTKAECYKEGDLFSIEDLKDSFRKRGDSLKYLKEESNRSLKEKILKGLQKSQEESSPLP